MNRTFLGGTCADTVWREELMGHFSTLNRNKLFFNPIVSDWTPNAIALEDFEKKNRCSIHLYVLTCEMRGVYSIAEAVQSSNEKGVFTYLHIEPEGFDESELRSLRAVSDLVRRNGGTVTEGGGMELVANILSTISK